MEDDLEDEEDDQEESRESGKVRSGNSAQSVSHYVSSSVLYQQWKTTWKMMEDDLEDD